MATTPQTVTQPPEGGESRLQELAKRHLWMHFTRMSAYEDGAGFFQAIELVKDQATKESFDEEESEWLLRGFLSGALYDHGLICRADDRGDPVIQLSPPLVADTEQFEEIASILRTVLSEAAERLSAR